jgi:hypothetical protein
MKNQSAYLAAIRINDRLLEIYKKINHDMTLSDAAQVRTSLCEIASTLRSELDQHGALTAERQSQLDGVQGEAEHAEAAAKSGIRQDVWAAFMRAHGRINNVIVDVMQEMG